jgi:hypothetical protein
MILQKLSKMPNTIPKPKATKRVVWNLRTKTKQNWHKTSTSVQLTYKIQCRRRPACEATKAQNSRLRVLKSCFALSLWLNPTTLHYSIPDNKAPMQGQRSRQSIYPQRGRQKKRDQEKTRKKTNKNNSRGCRFAAVRRAVIARTQCTVPDPKPSTGKTES